MPQAPNGPETGRFAASGSEKRRPAAEQISTDSQERPPKEAPAASRRSGRRAPRGRAAGRGSAARPALGHGRAGRRHGGCGRGTCTRGLRDRRTGRGREAFGRLLRWEAGDVLACAGPEIRPATTYAMSKGRMYLSDASCGRVWHPGLRLRHHGVQHPAQLPARLR